MNKMIAYPPHQQVHPYHLALSLIILFLTVYPYLFNSNGNCWSAAAYSSEDFELKHSQIDEFDIIEEGNFIVSRPIFTRSARNHDLQDDSESNTITSDTNARIRIQFSALGQRFNLVLTKTAHLISDNFNIIALDKDNKQTIIPYNRNNIELLEGNLAEDTSSKATASFSKHHNLITAQIKSGDDMIIVEPTYLHRNNLRGSSDSSDGNTTMRSNTRLYDKTMIVYKLSDHEQFRSQSRNQTANPSELESFCSATSATIDSFQTRSNNSQSPISPHIEEVFKYHKPRDSSSRRTKSLTRRGIEFFGKQQPLKDKTRCTLHLVADYLFYKHVGNGDFQTTINYLLALIHRVNQIYLPTRWETGDERVESFDNIGFTVQDITIHQEFTRISSGDIHYNMQSDKIWGAREYLDNFSRYSPQKHYCLAHLLTYRQFDTPVLGLAYVASTRIGTIGGICSPTQQRGDALYKHNTGISTSKGINGETLITRQADLVLAHELGHNLGAEHDSNECRPAPAQGGAYLMHPYAVMGFEKNNRFLSNCSRMAIGRVIRRKASTCFIGIVDNVCGNGVVEGDEECDGGDVGHGNSDPCCDKSCRFTPGSQCSDRNSWCCSKCHIVPAGRPCRQAEEFNCKQASYCDGSSAKCPDTPQPVSDNKVCVGRGLCRSGECIPFCEARELHSCLCNNPSDACKLCCKQSINGSCAPYDQRAPYLPDGVLCYRGVCEKGRCEQPIQDFVERLWDVIEDINFTTLGKFFRDNIILVVLVVSIPVWCLVTHFINKFDKSIKQDVINTIMKHRRRQKPPPTRSPFLPRLFVGDGNSSTNSLNDMKDEASLPLKQVFQFPPTNSQAYLNGSDPSLRPVGFQLPEGEEVVIGPRGSIVLNSIELPHRSLEETHTNEEIDVEPNGSQVISGDRFSQSGSYSTQV